MNVHGILICATKFASCSNLNKNMHNCQTSDSWAKGWAQVPRAASGARQVINMLMKRDTALPASTGGELGNASRERKFS